MKYYDIVPLTRTSLTNQQAFTYHTRSKLSAGSLVKISFSRYPIRGIVLKKVAKPKFPTKPVIELNEESLLTKKQLDLALEISRKYYTSLGVVLRFFIPKISKKKSTLPTKSSTKSTPVALTVYQREALSKIKKVTSVPCLLYGPASSGKTEIIFRLIEEVLQRKKQSLVLIPELLLSHQEISRYQKYFSKEKIAFYHSRCTSSQVRGIFKGVKAGSIKIIIATRIGLFLPFKDLGLVAVDEEQDVSFKQWDQMPHYHTRDVAQILTKLYGGKTIFSSSTPSLELLHTANARKIKLIRLPMLKTGKITVKKPLIQIVDSRKYFKEKAPFVISKELKSAVEETLKKKLISIFLIPRRGIGTRILCTDCKQIQNCPQCDTSLVNINQQYQCVHCKFKKPALSSCTNCKSMRLVDIGFGTEGASDILKTYYPQAKLLTIDSSFTEKIKEKKSAYKKIANNQVDFVVGTFAIGKGFDFANINTAVVLNADNWVGKIDFRHDERWARDLMQFSGRINRPNSDQEGSCIIQTFQNKDKFDFLTSWSWDVFAKKELRARRELGYPPYAKMIKISSRASSQASLDKKVNIIYNHLLETTKGLGLRINEPFYGFDKKRREIYKKHILITCKNKFSVEMSDQLKKLDSSWSIDVDPEFIF